jgi:transmembrane sensor
MKNSGPNSTDTPGDSAGRGSELDHSTLDWAREEGEADRVIDDLNRFLRHRRRRRLRALAAGVACVAITAFVWPMLRNKMMPASDARQGAASIVVMRPETRVLADGTTVELKAGAEIAVDFSGEFRRVELRRGEAHFQVAKNPQRTFVVTAAGVDVRAVGTAFCVGLGAQAIEVLVTEGHVAVEDSGRIVKTVTPAEPEPMTFGVGKRIVIDRIGSRPVAAVRHVTTLPSEKISEHLAWRVPRLEFAGTPLSQALPMFNEHARTRLTLADAALGKLQLSGVLRADDTESLLRLLEGEFGLKTEIRGDEIVLRR